MQLTITVPGLLGLPAATLEASAPFARLARIAVAKRGSEGFAAATLQALGGTGAPAAPLLALGAGCDPRADYVLVADPVLLVAGRDDVRLAARIDDLDATTVSGLIARCNAHFATDGLAFAAPRRDRWFVRTSFRPALVTVATDVVAGGTVLPHLPQGADARIWRRWGDELQMLLHAAPENDARERAGLRRVNGLWFWGGGMLTDVPRVPALHAYATADATGDLVRGLAQHGPREPAPLPSRFADSMLAGERIAIALPTVTEATLSAVTAAWIAPAVAALERGQLATLTLIADGDGVVTWRAARPSAWARVTGVFGSKPFVVPPRP